MKKRKFSILIALVLVFGLVGCSKEKNGENISETENIENKEFNSEITSTVDGFVSEMQKFNLEGFLQYINPAQKKSETLPTIDTSSDLFNAQLKYLQENASKITYKIEDVKENGDEATVKIRFKYTDMGNIIEETLINYVKETPSEKNLSEEEKNNILTSILEKEIAENDPINIEKSVVVNLIKVENKWYINNLKEDLLDVMMSNYINTFNRIERKTGV